MFSFVCGVCLCFVFKQKTAYEMRISGWSSGVCSSDLGADIDVADLQRVGGQRRSSSQGAAQRDGARCCGAAGQEMAARQVLEHESLLMVFVGCGLVELS